MAVLIVCPFRFLDSESEGPGSPPVSSSTASTTQTVFHDVPADDLATTCQDSLDDDVATLEARIVSLNVQNSRTAIARLPMELIQEIFVITSRSAGYRRVGKTALAVTWVCHSWRELAHGTSTLWSHIDFSNLAWIEVALSQARNQPLSLSFDFGLDDYEDAPTLFSLCLRKLPQIETLSVARTYAVGNELDVCLNPLWTTNAPMLVELALHNRTIPTTITPEIFPGLESLSLNECEFDWESLPLRCGLKTLSIHRPRSRISAEFLLDKLWALGSSLESLRLNETLLASTTIAPHHPNPSSGRSRKEFPKIRHFEMRDPRATQIIFILDHILLPSHVETIEINAFSANAQFDIAKALISCRGLENWPTKTVEFDLQYDILVFWATDPERRESISFTVSTALDVRWIYKSPVGIVHIRYIKPCGLWNIRDSAWAGSPCIGVFSA
ncbi:hypothetical protein BDN72DRAFT_864150 [Pluteus cervinus]|uniref:Uncharacterized protein n=1 Tax=Pluteus cervinus TaxID=181527 RepID=A0ACD3A5V5_9AGAR|nr:hypothetical protein BDN72DRAFT_864150 [Pluteus cervinus]